MLFRSALSLGGALADPDGQGLELVLGELAFPDTGEQQITDGRPGPGDYHLVRPLGAVVGNLLFHVEKPCRHGGAVAAVGGHEGSVP